MTCKPAPPQPATPAASGPQIRATVVTIRTTTLPENKSITHTLVIAGDHARATNEHDTWRLYDTKANTVTYVDDIAKTIRTETLAQIVKRRHGALANALPEHYPRATLTHGTKRTLQGVTAEQSIITAATFRHELWLGEHPAIPRGLFALMHASEPLSSPLAPMMRDVEEPLLATRAFPLAEHIEMTFGNSKIAVDREVVSIAQQNVPASLVTVPAYRR
ncbi:MAG: hypothetical protein JO197_05220 [Acidobacteria bacterium]|nr:hypothetical protein [Acidobacteriota bacterium]MBV9477192.1 hypothetical protein [Acidobacteriota bacterium]